MYLTETKQCTKCKQYLELSNFHKNYSDYKSQCKFCRNKQKCSYRLSNSGSLNTWVTNAFCDSKRRAKDKKLEHNLTKEWILANLPKVCPVLGVELSFTGSKYNSPSLDRFDNNKGYTIDNVRIISWRANTLKSNATIEELEAIVRYMSSKDAELREEK